MMTDTRICHHQSDCGRWRASKASMPQARPALPTANASDASSGTSSSHIHAVPNSDTQRLAKKAHATSPTGRVSSPNISRIPSEISSTACAGPAIAEWPAKNPMIAFHIAGA